MIEYVNSVLKSYFFEVSQNYMEIFFAHMGTKLTNTSTK